MSTPVATAASLLSGFSGDKEDGPKITRTEKKKAAALLNMIRYVSWKEDKDGTDLGSRNKLCISKDADILNGLVYQLEKKRYSKLGLELALLEQENITSCTYAYFSDSDLDGDLPKSALSENVMTISTGSGFAEVGVVGLFPHERHYAFSINLDYAEAIGVTFSSRFLRLTLR